ncbi:MAG TPA: EF-hand domain-containing protein [Chthoniobacterales bacterium]|nr:EF-hand domain-containing protein [Chthoniobacterales bacterium]
MVSPGSHIKNNKNIIMNKSLSLISVGIAVLVLSACQTTKAPSSAEGFAQADSNKDARLDRGEASDYYVTSLFTGRDENRDGKLTWEEWKVLGHKESKAGFNAADKDKDGSLSLEEARVFGRKSGAFADTFRQADTDRDGYVTLEEARNLYASTEGPVR